MAVPPPTGPPRLMAGDRRRPLGGELRVASQDRGLEDSFGDKGSGNSEKEPDLERTIRSLTGGSL